MLQATITFSRHLSQEEIAVDGQLSKEGGMGGANAREVPLEAGLVGPMSARQGEPVRYPKHLEGNQAEDAHFDGVVDQVLIVIGIKNAKAERLGFPRFEAGGQTPVCIVFATRAADLHLAREPVQAANPQKEAGTVEIAMSIIQMGRPHTQISGVNLQAHPDEMAARHQAPGLFIELLQGQGALLIHRLDGENVSGKVPDHVTARDPGGQGQHQGFGVS
jgi:hypothetical protein